MKFDACIDAVTPDGRIIGWACRPGHVERLHLGLFWGDLLIGEGIAQDYRPGLLGAGYGLGHCEFNVRLLTPPSPSAQIIELRLLDWGAATLAFSVDVPVIVSGLARPPTVMKPCWMDDEVLSNLTQFQLSKQLASVGPERFTDGAYRFILNRWADDHDLQEVRQALASGTFDPEMFVAGLINSEERRMRRDEPLPSPFDYSFPFRYPTG